MSYSPGKLFLSHIYFQEKFAMLREEKTETVMLALTVVFVVTVNLLVNYQIL